MKKNQSALSQIVAPSSWYIRDYNLFYNFHKGNHCDNTKIEVNNTCPSNYVGTPPLIIDNNTNFIIGVLYHIFNLPCRKTKEFASIFISMMERGFNKIKGYKKFLKKTFLSAISVFSSPHYPFTIFNDIDPSISSFHLLFLLNYYFRFNILSFFNRRSIWSKKCNHFVNSNHFLGCVCLLTNFKFLYLNLTIV